MASHAPITSSFLNHSAAEVSRMVTAGALAAPCALALDHPDATLGTLCATLDALRSILDRLDTLEDEHGEDFTASALGLWDDLTAELTVHAPATLEGLKVKTRCALGVMEAETLIGSGALERIVGRGGVEGLAPALARDTLRLLREAA